MARNKLLLITLQANGRFPFTVLQMASGTVKPVTSGRHLLQSRQKTKCIREPNSFLLPDDTIPIRTEICKLHVRSHVATVTGLDKRYTKELRYANEVRPWWAKTSAVSNEE